MQNSSEQLEISIAGGDTARDRNLTKRVAVVERASGGLRGKRVLDCGSGAGDYTRAYARAGALALGVEYQRHKLERARERPEPSLHFVRGDITALPLPDRSMDVIVLNEVLEHVPDDAAALAEQRRVLKRGGRLVVLSPNRLYPFEAHGVRRKGRRETWPPYTPFVPYVPLRLGALVFDYWARNYFPWELRRMVRAAGFDVIATGFVGQTFENVTRGQPRLVKLASPLLRAFVDLAERVPVANALCSVSQLIVATPR